MFEIFYWSLGLFLASLGIFIFVLTHERRSMWAGFTLTTTLMFLGFLAIDTIIIIDTKFPGHHQIISQILLLLAVGIALLIFLFVILLILKDQIEDAE